MPRSSESSGRGKTEETYCPYVDLECILGVWEGVGTYGHFVMGNVLEFENVVDLVRIWRFLVAVRA